MTTATTTQPVTTNIRPALSKRMNALKRYLTVWVSVCMVAGVALGQLAPELITWLRGLEFGTGSQINAPIAVLMGRSHARRGLTRYSKLVQKVGFCSLTA